MTGRWIAALLLVAAIAGAQARGGRESVVPLSGPHGLGTMLFPIAPEDYLTVGSPFGVRVSPELRVLAHHDGLDIVAVHLAQVVAVADGWVVEPWPPPGVWWFDGRTYRGHPVYGGMVLIAHGGGMYSLYAHLSALYVFDGQPVRRGQPIGRQGDTGQADGEHLHLEIRLGAQVLNPLLYIRRPEDGG